MRHSWALTLVLLAAMGCGTVTTTTNDTSGTGGQGGTHVCGPQASCTRCNDGACCGNTCCNVGEWCDTSGALPVCRCGTAGACSNGNLCTPALSATDHCGAVCCQGSTCP